MKLKLDEMLIVVWIYSQYSTLETIVVVVICKARQLCGM
jgi:hypothetical protein